MSIERKVVIGLITSTDFLKQIRKDIEPKYIQSSLARLLSQWCLEYYDEFNRAPFMDIETIYHEKLKKGNIDKDLAEEIEDDILADLSQDYEENGIQLDSLLIQADKYFREQKLHYLKNAIEKSLSRNDLEEAEQLVDDYKVTIKVDTELIMNSDKVVPAVNKAFTSTYKPVLKFSGALGEFWNHQMTKGSFVAFLSPEKRGKTAMKMEIALRGVEQGKNVAFFQAGDMTESQLLRRALMRITRRTDKEKHSGLQYFPVRDCVMNQLNLCDKVNIRECNFGIFEGSSWDAQTLRKEVTFNDLLNAFKDEPSYQPCYNCSDWLKNRYGAVYLKQEKVKMLSVQYAEKAAEEWFIKKDRNLRISTHSNGTLSVKLMRQILNTWKIQDNWEPELILVDYADLMITERHLEERHKQNQIWKDLRGLNQDTDSLLITSTQSDASSYEQDTLRLKNFSEDKRKYAHVTAMYGLNQDRTGREKKLMLLRIYELILREDDFDINNQVTVLQGLKIARPILASYF